MRLIWTTDNVEQLRKFLYFLRAQGIDCVDEEQTERSWESSNYGTKKVMLWVHDEDQVPIAQQLLSEFLKDPSAPLYSQTSFPTPKASPAQPEKTVPIPKENQQEEPLNPLAMHPRFRLTNFLIVLCSVLLLIGLWTTPKEEAAAPGIQNTLLATSPLQKALLFDYPESYELLDKIINIYGYQALVKPNNLPPPGKFLFETYLETQSWQGIYPSIVDWGRLHLRSAPKEGKEAVVERRKRIKDRKKYSYLKKFGKVKFGGLSPLFYCMGIFFTSSLIWSGCSF